MTEQTMQKTLPGIDFNDLDTTAIVNVSTDSSGRCRRTYRFELDGTRAAERAIGESLAHLKKQRAYLPFIRNALRLMFSLLAGDLSVLMELFPNIVQRIRDDAIADYVQERPASSDFEALIRDFADHIDDRLDAVQAAVATAPQSPLPGLQPVMGQTIAMQPVAGGPTQLAAPQFDVPDFDDDADIILEVRKDETAGAVAGDNFIRAMMALQNGS